MKVTSLVYWVKDNETSEKFYKKLGFRIKESNERHSVLALGDFEIILVSMRDESEFAKDSMSEEKGKGAYLYIESENVNELYSNLLSRGITPSSEPRDWDWGNREFVVKDSDGYKICFWSKI